MLCHPHWKQPEIGNRRKPGTFTNLWKIILKCKNRSNDQSIKEEITKEIRKHFEMNENKKQNIKTYGIQQEQRLEGNLEQ